MSPWSRVQRLGRIARTVPRIPTLRDLAERAMLASLVFGSVERAPRGLDWSVLLELAHRYAMTGPLSAHCRSAVFPVDVRVYLEDRREALVLQNRLLLRDAKLLAAALAEAAVPHVFLKGTALLARFFEQLAARQTDDIDLLIHGADLARAESALLAAGCTKSPHQDLQPGHRHPLKVLAPSGTLVEVHVSLTPGQEALEHACRSRAQPFVLDDVVLRLPHPEDLLEHLAHHALEQHHGVPRYLPRHLLDVAAFDPVPASVTSAGGWPPYVQVSFELLQVARRCAESPAASVALAAFLFPEHHSAIPKGIDRRLRGGFRGWRTELASLRRSLSFFFYDAA